MSTLIILPSMKSVEQILSEKVEVPAGRERFTQPQSKRQAAATTLGGPNPPYPEALLKRDFIRVTPSVRRFPPRSSERGPVGKEF